MPWFLQKLSGDYAAWAEDKPRSSTMGAGEMASLAKNLLAGAGRLPPGVGELPVVGAADGAQSIAPSADEVGEQAPVSTRGVGFGARGGGPRAGGR
jgi:hypothetical protein